MARHPDPVITRLAAILITVVFGVDLGAMGIEVADDATLFVPDDLLLIGEVPFAGLLVIVFFITLFRLILARKKILYYRYY